MAVAGQLGSRESGSRERSRKVGERRTQATLCGKRQGRSFESPIRANGLCPDFEQQRNDPDFPFQIVAFDMEPGDAVIFHPHTRHFSRGNNSSDIERIGLAVRVFGDDVRWYPAPYKAPIPGVSNMPEGQAPDGELFPVIWRR
jgi:hypothetical protein